MNYYRDLLDPSGKNAYDRFYKAILAGDSSAAAAGMLSGEQMTKIIQAIDFDHPELFYVEFSRVSFQIGLGRSVWNIQYTVPRARRNAAIADAEDQIRRALRQIGLTGQESPVRIYRKVHNYLCRTVTYNYEALKNPEACPEAFTVIGALGQKSAVCEGIAKAFQLLCERAGAKDVILVSGISSCEGVGDSQAHAWNIVRTGRGWAHVDVTWDLCLSQPDFPRRYDYFLIPDAWARADHDYTCGISCQDQTECYFAKNHCLICSTGDLESYLKEKLGADSRDLYFKIAGKNEISAGTLRKVRSMTEGALRRYCGSYSAKCSGNEEQHIYIYVIRRMQPGGGR